MLDEPCKIHLHVQMSPLTGKLNWKTTNVVTGEYVNIGGITSQQFLLAVDYLVKVRNSVEDWLDDRKELN